MATAQLSLAISGGVGVADCAAVGRREPKKMPPTRADARALEGCPLPCSSPLRNGGAAVEHEHTEATSSVQRSVRFPAREDTAIASEACGAADGSQMSLRLFDSVHRIGEMQSSLAEQLQKSHAELLQQIRAVQVTVSCIQAPVTPGRRVSAAAQQAPALPRISVGSDQRSDKSARSSVGSWELMSSSGANLKPQLELMPSSLQLKKHARNTQAYTDAAMKHANLQFIREHSVKTFNHVLTNPLGWLRLVRRRNARRLLRSNSFDSVIGLVILMNSICIGWEISADAEGNVTDTTKIALQSLDFFFLSIYCTELSLRFYADRLAALHNRWVCFDCLLVFSGLCGAVIRNVSFMTANASLQEAMKQVMLLRILRLLRLVRALRLVRQFKTLWRLVNGLLTSLDTMLSTLALVTLVLYVAACIGVELITGNEALLADPEIAKLIGSEFRSVPTTMLALVQFVTMDDLSDLYKPIIREQPLMFVYFVSILMIVSIALLNLVTAVLVEGALEKSRKDKEMEAIHLRRQVKSYLPFARDLFQKMDVHGTGVLTLDMIQQKLEEEDDSEELTMKLKEIVPFETVLELFESLDIDGDGEIPEQEFVDGVLKSALAGRDNLELTQIMRLLRVQARKIDHLALTAGQRGLAGSALGNAGSAYNSLGHAGSAGSMREGSSRVTF